jgi:hypothetical protein
MPLCPYCHKTSFTRRQHVVHLQQAHPKAYAHNVATSGNCTVSATSRTIRVPDCTPFGPVQRNLFPSSSGNVQVVERTVHCAVCFSYDGSWVPATSTMALHHTCYDCCERVYYIDFPGCDHTARPTRCARLYCPRGVCHYPHPSSSGDDRIRDWGGRGRVDNVTCRGHFPVLCPVAPEWLRARFHQTSLSPALSTRSPSPHDTLDDPSLFGVDFLSFDAQNTTTDSALVRDVESPTGFSWLPLPVNIAD